MKIIVRRDELLFKPLFLKANTIFSATVIHFLFFLSPFFDPLLMGSLLPYIISFSTISIVYLLII